MAYVPPHKRSAKGGEKELHPESLSPKFGQQLRLGSGYAGSKDRQKNVLPCTIQYSENFIRRCFPVGTVEHDELPDSIRLEPYPCLAYEQQKGKKFFALRNVDQPRDSGTRTCCMNKEAWLYIAEKIQSDVLTAFQNVRDLIQDDEHSDLKPSFIARVGKILFHSKQSISLEKLRKSFHTELDPKSGVSKMFSTDVTEAYTSFIESKVVQDIGLVPKKEKDHHILKIEDKSQPDCVLSCKCIVKADGKLELRKIEASPLRHLLVDLPCLLQDLDLRIMLITKRIMESFTDEEKCRLKEIIESAIVDPNVKGGLRWPLGKESAGANWWRG